MITNKAYDHFINTYSDLYNAHFPIKKIKGKALKTFRCPWITRGLLKSIRKKNQLYKKYLKEPNEDLKSKYKSYKNKLSFLIRKAKKPSIMTVKFEETKQNLKATWNLIRNLMNKRSSKTPLPSHFQSNGKTINDPTEIANMFCKYFTNIRTSQRRWQQTNSQYCSNTLQILKVQLQTN